MVRRSRLSSNIMVIRRWHYYAFGPEQPPIATQLHSTILNGFVLDKHRQGCF